MEVLYRKAFLKDLKKLKNLSAYDRVFRLAFSDLPEAEALRDLAGLKAMKGYPNRYRIRIGNYRVSLESSGHKIELFRVLHRRVFYRYFP